MRIVKKNGKLRCAMAKYCDTQVLERNWFEWLVSSDTPSIEHLREQGMLWTLVIGTLPGSQIQDPTYETRLHYITTGVIFCTTKDKIDWCMRRKISSEQLASEGYYCEPTKLHSWQAMLQDIAQICSGIANKFNQQSIEETNNLAGEALLQVTSKLARGRLKYTPGKAPVFNLLTTTIHRCIYSILSRDTRQKKNFSTFVDNFVARESRMGKTSVYARW